MSDKLPVECFEMASRDLCSTGDNQSQADLLQAWRDENLEEFCSILSGDDCDPNFLYEKDNYMRLLDSMAEKGNVEFIKAILKGGADVNLINPVRSKAPIHFAAEGAHLKVLKLLVSNGADVNIRDSSGSTILHYMVKEKWHHKMKYKECLEYLFQLDQLDINLKNLKGLTAIHLAATLGSVEAVKILLGKGSLLDIDSVKVGVERRTAREEILHKFPQLENDLPRPRETCDIKMDGNMLFALLHDNQEERFCENFRKEMEDKAQKSLLKYTDGRHTFLQYCCENKYAKGVKALLECGADVNYAPNMSTRPVLIACRKGDYEILHLLLEQNPDMSPNEDDENPLHIIVKYTENSEGHFACLQGLLRRLKSSNLDINAQDCKGNTPLHYAAKYGGPKCVEELLKNGAYIGVLNKFKKPPLAEMSSSAFESYLDSCITATDVLDRGKNYMIKFNYNFLVPNSRFINSDLEDVKIPLTEDVDTYSAPEKSGPECLPLRYMSEDSHLRKLLAHPVLTSFILLKWQRVRVWYRLNLLFYILFCLLLTVYILFGYRTYIVVESSVGNVTEPELNKTMKIAHDKYTGLVEHTSENVIHYTTGKAPDILRSNSSESEFVLKQSNAVEVLRVCLIIFLAIITLRELFQVFIYKWNYIFDLENALENGLEILLLLVVSFVLFKDCSREFPKSTRLGLWCPQFSAVAILLSWFELVLFLGKHPMQSLHIEMFKRVSVNFIKFLAWYIILIIAFALTFFTLFRGCSDGCEENPFLNLGLSLFKSIVMLTGEFDASDIPFLTFIGTSHLIFIAFIFLIAIVLLNLLNGLAVTDTQTIRNEAYLYRCIALVKLISHIERTLLIYSSPFSCFKFNFGQNEDSVNINCFEYLARRILFFPNLLADGMVYVLPSQRYKICFTDPKSSKGKDQMCFAKCNEYYLDPEAAKTAERILAKRFADQESSGADLDSFKEKIESYGDRMVDMEKKIELLEQSTKQNEKLLIQILAILSLNNDNNDERRTRIQ